MNGNQGKSLGLVYSGKKRKKKKSQLSLYLFAIYFDILPSNFRPIYDLKVALSRALSGFCSILTFHLDLTFLYGVFAGVWRDLYGEVEQLSNLASEDQ